MSLIDALIYATKHHIGQTDKAGIPYIFHPIMVSSILMDHRRPLHEQVAGVLHDVVEDCEHATIHEILDNFGSDVSAIVDAVTRRNDETYDEFINRIIAAGESAMWVKLADLTHNSRIERISNPTKKDFLRIAKYLRYIEILKTHLNTSF